jgi:hypothetical protein
MDELIQKLSRDQKKRYNYYASHLGRHCQAQFGLLADPVGVLNRLTDKELAASGLNVFGNLPAGQVSRQQALRLLDDVGNDGVRVPDIAKTAGLIAIKKEDGTFTVPRYTRVGWQREGCYADMRKHGANRRVATLVHGASFHYILDTGEGTVRLTPLLSHAFVKRLSENQRLLNNLMGVEVKDPGAGVQPKATDTGGTVQEPEVEIDPLKTYRTKYGDSTAADLVAAETAATLKAIALELGLEVKARNKLPYAVAIFDCLRGDA